MATNIDLTQVSKDEIAAFEAFKRTYQVEHSAPRRPSVQLVSLLSWDFYLSMIVAICSVLLAASRTAPTFYQIAVNEGFDGIFAIISGAIALIAVEGTMFVGAMIRASRHSNVGKSWALPLAEGIAVAISVIAGLVFVFDGRPELKPYVSQMVLWLGLIVGVGATVLAWIAGYIVGDQIARSNDMSEKLSQEYRTASDAYREAMLSAWEHSSERKIARSELVAASKGRTNAAPVRSSERVVRSPARTTNEQTYTNGDSRQAIIDYLEANATPTNVPGPTAIAQALGNPNMKGYASEVRKAWMQNKNWFGSQHNETI